jgi:hypothetical protein
MRGLMRLEVRVAVWRGEREGLWNLMLLRLLVRVHGCI